MAVWQAKREGLSNFSMLVSHVLVPPAIRLLLDSPANRVQGFIAPGHVCTVMGYSRVRGAGRANSTCRSWSAASSRWICWKPSACWWRSSKKAAPRWKTSTSRSVTREGNHAGAAASWTRSSKSRDRKWRGIGEIPRSGYRLREEFAAFDAEQVFDVADLHVRGAAGVHQRAGAAGPEEAGGLPGVRHALHARDARWARPWFRPKAPARRTTSTGGTRAG